MLGVAFELRHPELALRDCGHCRRFHYGDDGKPSLYRGELVARSAGTFPPCCYPSGCPKGTWWDQKSLTPRNRQAYEHWQECRATGQFPPDPLVRRNARLIQSVYDMIDRTEQSSFRDLVLTIARAK